MDALPEISLKEFITYKYHQYKHNPIILMYLMWFILGSFVVFSFVMSQSDPTPEPTSPAVNTIVFMSEDGQMLNMSPTELIQQQAQQIHKMKQRESQLNRSELDINNDREHIVKSFDEQKQQLANEYNIKIKVMSEQVRDLTQQLNESTIKYQRLEDQLLFKYTKERNKDNAICEQRIADMAAQFRTAITYNKQ